MDGDVKNSTFSDTLQKAYPDKLIQGYIAEQNHGEPGRGHGGAGAGALRGHFRLLPLARLTTRCAWPPSAAATSICAARTAAFPSAKTGRRKWRSRIWRSFRAIPGAAVFYPSDAVCAERLTEEAARRPGICYIRTSRPKTPVLYTAEEKFPVPGLKVLRQSASDSVTVIGAGVTLYEALKAYDQLKRARRSRFA